MDRLAGVVVEAPVEIGDVIVPDVLATGASIIATGRTARSD
jgi:CxxC motif-containing protein